MIYKHHWQRWKKEKRGAFGRSCSLRDKIYSAVIEDCEQGFYHSGGINITAWNLFLFFWPSPPAQHSQNKYKHLRALLNKIQPPAVSNINELHKLLSELSQEKWTTESTEFIYSKLQIKIGLIVALSLGLTFFPSNFLWAERSRHVVKKGSSGLHSQAVEAKNPWCAYRGELRQDWEDKGEASNTPPCSSNAAPGWGSSHASEVETEALNRFWCTTDCCVCEQRSWVHKELKLTVYSKCSL